MTCFLYLITFLSAFLLFQIELIVAKILLPLYGGSYWVWGACVVFFQAALLLGYIYAHLVIQKFGIQRYRIYHLIFCFLPLIVFPGQPLIVHPSQLNLSLGLKVFVQLMLTVGPVFFVLSTMSIIWQSWLESSQLTQRQNPYALYGISNLGSFLGLLTYPVFFELLFDINTQLLIWSIGYGALLVFQIITFFSIPMEKIETRKIIEEGSVKREQIVRWTLFGAVGTIMFLAVTNITTSEIVPMPLLWILPLGIYLISFTLNFKRVPWCPRLIQEGIHVFMTLGVLLYFMTFKGEFPFLIELLLYSLFLFVICMYCQHQLIRSKPSHPRDLTCFYVFISAGSFLGGVLVSWIMPIVSNSYLEYLVGLVVLSLALNIGIPRQRLGGYFIRMIVYPIVLLSLWPEAFYRPNIFALLLLILVFKFVFTELKKNPRAFAVSLIFILCLAPFLELIWSERYLVHRERNFYGLYRIFDYEHVRFLQHGNTIHGAQSLIVDKQMDPLAYYHHKTPLAKVMRSNKFEFKEIGIVGLGTGSFAAYGQKGQTLDFFEIDADMPGIINQYFTYLKKSAGQINLLIGDARLTLENIKDKKYDLLVVDAFSGDAIPVHLLTREAFKIYRGILNPEGILLLHISNRYLKLLPVVSNTAYALKAHVSFLKNKDIDKNKYATTWMAVTWDKGSVQKLVSLKWKTVSPKKVARYRPWTDQYTNILANINTGQFIHEFKGLKGFIGFP